MRPDHSCSCSMLCNSVNVDGFTSHSPSSAINRSLVPVRFATVSAELSVTPESLQYEQSDTSQESEVNLPGQLLIARYEKSARSEWT
jgi:hypothetical protein